MRIIPLRTSIFDRSLLRTVTLLCLLIPGGGSLQAQSTHQDPLTFVSWGGAYTRSQMLAFVYPFEERFNSRVNVLDYHGGLEDIRDQVSSLNVKWDVVDLEPADAIRGCEEGLLQPLDPALLKESPDGKSLQEDFLPEAIQKCAVGTVVWSTVIAYDRQQFRDGPAPESLQDFFDTVRFPGPRGMRRTPKANLEWALISDGVPADQVYSVLETDDGLQRAFSVLDRLKPNIVWWNTGAQAPRLLEAGRVVMTTAYNGRVYDAMAQRSPGLRIIWDHQIWSYDLLGIPRHSRNREQAEKFIRFATSSEQLAEQARHIPYGPVRHSALVQVDRALRPHLPTEADNFANALKINAAWWAEHFDQINARFEEWLERPVQVPRALPH
ncbi:MAG: ABC transporter substrate-binding protein [Thiohalophilus sp.]